MIRSLLLLLVITLFSIPSQSQDLHFSQFYGFTANLNPALTANYDGSYRIAAIYRNQWGSFLEDNAFTTPAISVDFSLFEGQLKNDAFGLGFHVINDQNGGVLSTLNIGTEFAYHRNLGAQGSHRISLGGQLNYIQKNLDQENLVFYDQFDAITYEGANVTGEQLVRERYSYFDFNVGAYWKSYISSKLQFQGGFAAYHLTEPKESFIVTADNSFFIPMRYTADIGLNIDITDNIFIAPDVIFMKQSSAQEVMIGSSVGYYFSSGFRDKSSVHLGGRYRLDDAFSILTQVEFRNMRLGFAYDVNTSSLSTSSNHRGAYELSLIYIGESARSFQPNTTVPCRRF